MFTLEQTDISVKDLFVGVMFLMIFPLFIIISLECPLWLTLTMSGLLAILWIFGARWLSCTLYKYVYINRTFDDEVRIVFKIGTTSWLTLWLAMNIPVLCSSLIESNLLIPLVISVCLFAFGVYTIQAHPQRRKSL